MRLLIALIAAAVFMFGDGHMARSDSGFGAFDPTPMDRQRWETAPGPFIPDAAPQVGQNVLPGLIPPPPPPLPRPKPEQEAFEAWAKTPEGKAAIERDEREAEEWLASPEGKRALRELDERMKRMPPGPGERDI